MSRTICVYILLMRDHLLEANIEFCSAQEERTVTLRQKWAQILIQSSRLRIC